MSLPVLLLSVLIVQCAGCHFAVKNMKATIDSNPTGFRTVFPKNYNVVHHYKRSMLCRPDPCCVFPAAVVLLDSWHVLLRNLWDEHVNHSLIVELKETLDNIIASNRNTERFQEETELSQLPTLESSPEELLTFTSELLTRWLEVGCLPSIETCPLPTLPPSVERKDYGPSRERLLTTRSINKADDGQRYMMIDITQALSKGESQSPTRFSCACSLLLVGLCWLVLSQ